MSKKLEISKVLTLSTIHIKPETAKWIENKKNIENLAIYEKSEYGWFIFVEKDYLEELTEVVGNNIPQDLLDTMNFARLQGCEWLCLDCDGNEIDDLPSYDWRI